MLYAVLKRQKVETISFLFSLFTAAGSTCGHLIDRPVSVLMLQSLCSLIALNLNFNSFRQTAAKNK